MNADRMWVEVVLVLGMSLVMGGAAESRTAALVPVAAQCGPVVRRPAGNVSDQGAIAICTRRGCQATRSQGWGQRVDVDRLSGPIGRATPAIDSATARSLDDVASFCEAHPDYDAAPPLLPLPTGLPLPSWCDEVAAFRQVEAACGPLPVVVVSSDARAEDADGSPAAPFASIGEALAVCEGPCHVLVAPGLYAESLTIPRCTVVEGGVTVAGGAVTVGAARPRIEGAVRVSSGDVILARIDVEHGYGALSVDGDALVSESVLRGGYEAGSSAWSATGPRICASHLAGGYSGFGISWQSSHLWIAGSAISACYEGASIAWGSSDLRVVGTRIYGHYEAVGTSWGSFGVDVRKSELHSAHAAVGIHIAPDLQMGPDGFVELWPASFDVEVIGNRVRGSLPTSDEKLGIRVERNGVK